jgi:4-hydroxybenzoate polyprenyltransferase
MSQHHKDRPQHVRDVPPDNNQSTFNKSARLQTSLLQLTLARCYTNYPPNFSKGNEDKVIHHDDTKRKIIDANQRHEDSCSNDNTNPLQSTSTLKSGEQQSSLSSSTNNYGVADNTKPSEPSIHNISYLPPSLLPYAHLARLDKPIGTMLLLHPCLWSTALAYTPLLSTATTATTAAAAAAAAASPLAFTILCTKFALGSFIMRGAGCTINDMWDAKYDKQVTRTKSRPLASGALSYNQAWMFLGAQLTAGLAVLLSLEPHLQDCFVWGAASLPLVGMYPLMKRYTNYPQLVLGLTFNWGAIMGWVAVHGNNVNWSVVGPLYASGVCWTLIYDTLYAHQDKTDDAKLGLKSTALTFGEEGTKPILTALTGVTWGCWMLAGYNVGFGDVLDVPLYYGGVSAAAAHLLWQVYTADLDNVENLAYRFRSNNTVGWMVFASCVGGNLMMIPPMTS